MKAVRRFVHLALAAAFALPAAAQPVATSPAAALTNAEGYTNLVAGAEATDTLMRGFTTVRDVGVSQELGQAFPVGSEERRKFEQVYAGNDTVYALARKYKLKTAWGTDVLFSQALAQRQGAILTSMARWYTPAEVLKMATGDNAQLLALSGKRSPYAGSLGVVEEGALADLLLVDGNPLEDLRLLENPGKNLVVIMKDGKVYKNLIPAGR
jgi:imidazolonepropionase-like amidohydrolase